MIKQLLTLLGGRRIFASKMQLLPILSLFIFIVAACAGGQAPEASKARSRAVIRAGDIVPAEEIRVAEYLKYYEQHFPESTVSTLGLDLRPGNVRLPLQGGAAWIQMGLQAKSDETEFVAPLNLALVIDSSGSMADHDKMPYVKESLRVFLDSLSRDDIVTIITYSDDAQLLRPAEAVGDGGWIRSVVNRISPGGSTNLHAGLMLGFREVERNFDVRRNNRVLLLTDGMANVGITHPDRIAANALVYNDRGIFLSTIGLGLEFNDDLLSQLAHQGKGGYSFVDSAKEMDRIFQEHVAGLKQRAASEISLTVIPEPGVRLVSLTGYEGSLPAGGINIPLPPLGTGDSNVVLAQLQVAPVYRAGEQSIAKVELNYFDEFSQDRIRIAKMVTVERTSLTDYDPVWDVAVLRNVTIQDTAEGMRTIDRLVQSRQYETAWRLAIELENRLAKVFKLTNDEQLLEDMALMQRYQQNLAEVVWQAEGRAPRLQDDVELDLSGEDSDSERRERKTLPTVEIR